jgi:FMN phosphatase YigB (HAD superfamily)
VRACESIRLTAADVLMVGDDPRSDGGAVIAGIRTLLLPPPASNGDDNGLEHVLHLVR